MSEGGISWSPDFEANVNKLTSARAIALLESTKEIHRLVDLLKAVLLEHECGCDTCMSVRETVESYHAR